MRADGTDNGFFVRDRGLHWINEETASLPNLAISWDFDKLLGDRMPAGKTPPERGQRTEGGLLGSGRSIVAWGIGWACDFDSQRRQLVHVMRCWGCWAT